MKSCKWCVLFTVLFTVGVFGVAPPLDAFHPAGVIGGYDVTSSPPVHRVFALDDDGGLILNHDPTVSTAFIPMSASHPTGTVGGYNETYGYGQIIVGPDGTLPLSTIETFAVGTIEIEPQSGAPTSPSEGWMYYDSDDDEFYGYDGTDWQSFITGGTSSVSLNSIETNIIESKDGGSIEILATIEVTGPIKAKGGIVVGDPVGLDGENDRLTVTADNGAYFSGTVEAAGGFIGVPWTEANPYVYVEDRNVGIGTQTPGSSLEVAGTLEVTTGMIKGNDIMGASGTYGSGNYIPYSGAGTRMFWYPRRGAFRAGTCTGTEWDDASIGEYTATFGQFCESAGDNSFSSGYNCESDGVYSFSHGNGNLVYGQGAFSIGELNNANTANTMALGKWITATGAGNMIVGIGVDNTNRLTGAANSFNVGFNSTVPTLHVGAATGAGTFGSVGIGTTTPSATLEVNGDVKIADTVEAEHVICNDTAVFNEDGNTQGDFRVEGDTDQNLIFGDANTNRVGIGTATPSEKLEVNGAIKLGTSAGTNDGTIRWDGSNFQGYNSGWVNLDSQDSEKTTNEIQDIIDAYSYNSTEVYTKLESDTTLEAYIDPDDYVNKDGTVALTGDWDIGDGRKIQADKIQARDGAGLYLVDDADNGIFVEDGGQVGIGTATPSQPLEVSGSGVSQRIKITATDGSLASLWLENTEGGTQFINDEDVFGIYDQDEAAYRLRILDNGYIGLNRDSPSCECHIYGTSGAPALDGSTNLLRLTQSGNSVGLDFGVNPNSPFGGWLQSISVFGGVSYPLSLNPSGGNVGIGTASPNAKLDVEGNIYPHTDDTYYLGKNDDDTPFAWKGVVLKDTTNGKYYRIEVVNGVVTATDLTD